MPRRAASRSSPSASLIWPLSHAMTARAARAATTVWPSCWLGSARIVSTRGPATPSRALARASRCAVSASSRRPCGSCGWARTISAWPAASLAGPRARSTVDRAHRSRASATGGSGLARVSWASRAAWSSRPAAVRASAAATARDSAPGSAGGVSSSARSARSAAVCGAEPSVCAAAVSRSASDAGSPGCAACSR